MRKHIILLILVVAIIHPVKAYNFTAPPVPESGKGLLEEAPETFTEGLMIVLAKALDLIQPAIKNASKICLSLIALSMLTSLVTSIHDGNRNTVDLVASISIASVLLYPSGVLIQLGTETVWELSEYGKLLVPVMTAAVAAQGGTMTSTTLYVGTAFFNSFLSNVITAVLVPALYIYLCMAIVNCAIGEELAGKFRDFVRWGMIWGLKIVLYVFTGYIGITGVISGSADALAVKATKIAISGMVPVVGGILSDASETVLVGTAVMKNAAGVYGVLALLAVVAEPFIRIGVQYLLLKITAAISGTFSTKRISALIQDFSSGMGLLLAMTGTVCLMLMISTVCFMKGMG